MYACLWLRIKPKALILSVRQPSAQPPFLNSFKNLSKISEACPDAHECESSKDSHCPCLAMGGIGARLPICLLLSWRTEEAGPCFVLCHPLDLPGLPRKPWVGEERGHNHGRKLNYRLRPSQLQKVDPKDGGCSLGESTQGLPCLCLRGCPSDPHGLPLQGSPCQPLSLS